MVGRFINLHTMTSPSSPHLKALEELELSDPPATPSAGPSRVRAAAAMWGTSSPSTDGFANVPLSPAITKSEAEAPDSFIVNRVAQSAGDRRLSREVGGGEKLQQDFERVREAKLQEEVDWAFWGVVVQDYEEVARTRPAELSRAIQQGIPEVIRGSIWQLMSSSKSPPLEETYKELLRRVSPHERAITKDLARTSSHPHFQGTGRDSLFMVLKAYSLYDEEVGYCQGLAFIVAALLLNVSCTLVMR